MKNLVRSLAAALALVAPSLFAEDAYLESDGTQYIVTGYHPTEKMKLVIDFQLTEVTKNVSVFGNGYGENGVVAKITVNGNGNLELGYKLVSGEDKYSTSFLTAIDTARYTIDVDYAGGKVTSYKPDGTYVNSKTLVADRRGGTGVRPLSFFCATPELANIDQQGRKVKLYSAQVTEDGVVIHDYVPCKKGDRIGLYDKKTGEFWNSATRELAIGGDDYMTIEDDPYISCAGNNIASGTKAVFNTYYKPNAKTRVELDYALAAYYTLSSGDWALMICNWDGTNDGGLFGAYHNANGFGVSMDMEKWKSLGTMGSPKTYGKEIRRTLVIDIPNRTSTMLVSGYPAGSYTMTGAWTEGKVYNNLVLGGYVSGNGGCAPMKVYGFKIYEDDELVHDYVPSKIGGEGFLKDKVTGLTLTPMNPQYPFAASENVEALPYVESTGNQIVVLDYKPNAKSVIEVDTDGLERVKDTNIFGVSDNSGSCQFHVNSSTDDKGPGMEAYMHSVWGFRMVTGLEKYGQRIKFMLDVPKSYAYARKADGTNLGSTNFATGHNGYSADVAETTIPMALFNVNKTTPDINKGAKVKIYSAKVWEGGELLHSYQPYVKDGNVGFKDMVTGKFFSGLLKSGTTTQVDALKFGGGAIANEGVQSEAYIESDQTQYIKTDYIPTTATKVEIDFQLTKVQKDFYIFGANKMPYWDFYVNGNYGFTTICGTDWNGFTQTTASYWADTQRTKMVIDRARGKWSIYRGTSSWVDWKTYATALTPQQTVPFGIFARQESNGAHYPAAGNTTTGGMVPMKLYSFRAWENNVLTLELLPYKNGDVTGLKDTVSGKIYTSSEGNPFVVGGQGYTTASGAKATFATGLDAKAAVKYNGTKKLGAVHAPGAVKYVWTKDGEVIEGENGPSLDIVWQKKPATATYAVKPVYNVYGTETEGEATSSEVEFRRAGLSLVLR